ncbi:MAG: zinc ribbon domain-containing protein [Clostridia bacterium]|nr:zinc ribbon domain-containing protein [Clostridia bacterium]
MFCNHCGNQVDENVAFCSRCGSRVEMKEHQSPTKEITGDFPVVMSKIPLRLDTNEVLIEQHSAAFVLSSISQGIFSLTNKRIIFTKDGAGKAFFKRGGLLGMALNMGAKIPDEIRLDEIRKVEPTSCLQGKAAMLVTIISGYQYKIALQSMAFGKTNELCEARDRIVELINNTISKD